MPILSGRRVISVEYVRVNRAQAICDRTAFRTKADPESNPSRGGFRIR